MPLGGMSMRTLTGRAGCSRNSTAAAKATFNTPVNTSNANCRADAVMAIMEHRTLTAALVRTLNPERSHDELTCTAPNGPGSASSRSMNTGPVGGKDR